jgi:deoxyribonuclease II
MNGINPLPTYCSPQYTYDVINIREVSLSGIDWLETKDHSKWAVSFSTGKYWSCIGDINRQDGQTNRAGGTVCYQNSPLWKDLTAMIVSSDSC